MLTLATSFYSVLGYSQLRHPPSCAPVGFEAASFEISFVDWIFALIDESNRLLEFVAVEVQSIDTTGNYRAERIAYLTNQECVRNSPGGINWENVNKRILPQLIFKGHLLRLEPLCRAGLFFVCPSPVLARIEQRVGSALRHYPNFHPGTITFRSYDPGPSGPEGDVRSLALAFVDQYTTTVDQLAIAFTAPVNLPTGGNVCGGYH